MERMDHEDRVFWSHFIEKWRTNPCLWDPKSEEYKSKYLRDVALQQLLDIYLKKYPDGDRQTIIKKLANFRSAYYRELKKVKNSVSKYRNGVMVETFYFVVCNMECFLFFPYIR